MGKRIEFKLPDIGEGVAEGEITSWKVKPGDVLKEDQIMVEVMTDKATVEIGSPVNGTVREILAAEGQAVPVGSVIIVLEEGAAAGAAPASAPKAPPAQAAPPASPAASRPAQPAHGAPSAPPAAGRPAQPAAARPMQPAQPNAARPMQPAQPAASRPASGATQGGHKPGEPAQPERAPTVERQTAAAAAGAVSAPKSSAAGAPRGGAGREEINFALPDIGEGVAEGEVTRWMVKPGDAVREDQPIVEVMTDKATVEIGSPVDGEVLALLVKEGETVPVGAILLVLGAAAGAGRHVPVPHGSAGKPAGAHTASAAPAPVAAGSSQPELHFEDEAHPTMAGEGGGEPHGGARERAPSPAVARAAQVVGAQAGDGSHGGSHGGSAGSALALADSGLPSRGDGSRRVRAAPATRRFAREAGVDVGALNGSGPDGRILMDDVRAAIAGTSPAARAPGAGMPSAASGASRTGAAAASSAPSATRAGAPPAAPAPPARPGVPASAAASAPHAGASASAAAPAASPATGGRAGATGAPAAPLSGPKPYALEGDERVPLRGLRKRIAAQMRLSKQTAAHFTYVEEIDVTELVKLRAAAKARAATAGVKLTYMPFIIKAVCVGLREFPLLNASLDEAAGELVMHHDHNIGVAVDTPAGLIVPVVRRADGKSMTDLAREMAELAERARAGKTAPADVGGGTFTITNAGNIGGLLATPIINVPEVAILGVHAIRRRPWVVEDEIVIRDIMLLSLSLDHRVVDGAVGAYFMNRVKELLENPGLMLFEEP